MKKNKSMRAAGGLLIATMLTSSIVSGTYAKYVTSDEAEDTARVAKFGVTVTASGSLFDTTYKAATDNTPGGKNATDSEDGTTLTVESSGAINGISNVVAPGTKNDEGLTFAIAGTPEVDVKLDVVVDDSLEEIFLNAGTYPDMTTGNEEGDDDIDNFTIDDPYYPVKFKLTQTKKNPETGKIETIELTQDNKRKLSDVKDALKALSTNSIDANTNLADTVGTLNLTWEWAFEGNDQADTLLGDLAAGTTLVPATTLTEGMKNDYNLEEKIKIAVTVTQVD